MKLLLSVLLLPLLSGCSLDASLIAKSKVTPEIPTTPDTPETGSEAIQLQKISFEFGIRKPVAFGENIAATPDGSFLFVTASKARDAFPLSLADEPLQRGAVIVYKRTGATFVQHQILRHPDTTESWFGHAVGTSNEWVAIGTMMDDTMENNSTADSANSGSAILYKWNSTTSLWEYSQKIKAPVADRFTTLLFGSAFAVEGTKLAVYAERADNSTYSSGAVFMYNFDGSSWQFVQKITAASPVSYRYFGSQPVLQSGKLYLSESDNGIPGRVDVFEYDGSLWNKVHSMSTAIPTGSRCAKNFAVQGDLLAMGCPEAYDSLGNDVVGQVNIFKFNGTSWVDAGSFEDGTGNAWNYFGRSLRFAGTHLYVSGNYDYRGGNVFKFAVASNGTATKVKTILPEQQDSNSEFGARMEVIGDLLLVTQYSPAKISDTTGAVHLYDLAANESYLGAISIAAVQGRPLSPNANLGASLAVTADGSHVIAGSPGNPYQDNYIFGGPINSKNNLGSVQFYKKNTDRTLKTLGARSYNDNNRRDAGMLYGKSVSVSGNYAAVGAPQGRQWFDPPFSGIQVCGLVSLNTADFNDTEFSWGSAINILPPQAGDSIDSQFGAAVKLHGADLVVGAPEHSLGTGSNYGKVFTYTVNYPSWGSSPATTLDAGLHKSADMRFGASVDYDGSVLAVGAPGASQTPDAKNAAGAGGVWIYNYNGTTATLQNILMGDQIYADDGSVVSAGNSSSWQASDGFGSIVMISGNQIFVSSPGANSGAGAVFVYTFNSVSSHYEFTERLDMTAHPGQLATVNAAFGSSLAKANDLLIVGAPGETLDSQGTTHLNAAGAVFLLKKNGGSFKGFKKLTATGAGNRTIQSRFGASVAYAANALYVGSPGHELNENGTDSVTGAGAIFVFDITGLAAP